MVDNNKNGSMSWIFISILVAFVLSVSFIILNNRHDTETLNQEPTTVEGIAEDIEEDIEEVNIDSDEDMILDENVDFEKDSIEPVGEENIEVDPLWTEEDFENEVNIDDMVEIDPAGEENIVSELTEDDLNDIAIEPDESDMVTDDNTDVSVDEIETVEEEYSETDIADELNEDEQLREILNSLQ